MHELRLSELASLKRICMARAARKHPAIFSAVAEGRLHLSTILQLKPYLTEASADDLLSAAANKGKSEIERLLAERYPRSDVPAAIQAISSQPSLPVAKRLRCRAHNQYAAEQAFGAEFMGNKRQEAGRGAIKDVETTLSA